MHSQPKSIYAKGQKDLDDNNLDFDPAQDCGVNADPFDDEESKLFENCSDVISDKENRRIQSIIKLVNARDPPNKLFESTVNLANKDAWKRRSIYLTKAQFQFDTQNVKNIRHSINFGIRPTTLMKDDSIEDGMFNNTDEGIGEMDRFIPSIGVPKCLTALKDKYLPQGLQKMLKQSTRFSLSYHMSSQESKFYKRESTIRDNIDYKYNTKRSEREEAKRNTEEVFLRPKEKSVHIKDSLHKSESSDKDDN